MTEKQHKGKQMTKKLESTLTRSLSDKYHEFFKLSHEIKNTSHVNEASARLG